MAGQAQSSLQSPPAEEISSRRGLPVWAWLALIYVVTVAVHFVSLKRQAEFPLLATDEAQYISVGDNIRLGHGFTTRGEFHQALPPLYPLLVAFAHSLGSDARMSMLLVSCLVMCLAIFPAFGLARYVGLERNASYLLAAAAGFLPHTLYAGLYMTETLNYPLFMAAFWMFAQWVERPTLRRDLAAGALLSAMLLTKLAAASFTVAVLVTVLRLWTARRTKDRVFVRPGLHPLVIFGMVVATQLGWQVFKHAHQSSALGMYGKVLSDEGVSHLSARLLIAYGADFLLAPALLTAVPLLLWFLNEGRRRFPLAVLLFWTLLFQIAIHAFLEAGITGYVRERLFLYSLPLMSIFAVKGMEALARGTRAGKILFVAVPLVLLGVLAVYPFPYNPAVDIPWASALGSFAWITVDTFTKRHWFIITAFTIVAGGIFVAMLRARRIQTIAASLVLVFNVLVFASAAKSMDELSIRARLPPNRIVRWLTRGGVHPNDRLIVCANMAYYEERHRVVPIDQFFLEWNRRFDLSDIAVLEIEVLGRYDVRIARSPEQIGELLEPGDRVLSATRLTDLDLVSYQWPYYLYTRKQPSTAAPRALYISDLTEELPFGWPLGYPKEQQNYEILGQPANLPAGRYRVTMYLKAQANQQFIIEAVRVKDNVLVVRREGTPAELHVFDLVTAGDSPLRFRLSGPNILNNEFQEAVIEYIGAYGDPKAPGSATGVFTPGPPPAANRELRTDCTFAAVNGAVSSPVFTIQRGASIQFDGWVNDAANDSAIWVELSSPGGTFTLPAEHSEPNADGLMMIRAAGNTQPIPAGTYRGTVVHTEAGNPQACVFRWNIAVTDNP